MWEIGDTLKIFKSIKLLVKMKNVSFILQKKVSRTFWPMNIFSTGCYVAEVLGLAVLLQRRLNFVLDSS